MAEPLPDPQALVEAAQAAGWTVVGRGRYHTRLQLRPDTTHDPSMLMVELDDMAGAVASLRRLADDGTRARQALDALGETKPPAFVVSDPGRSEIVRFEELDEQLRQSPLFRAGRTAASEAIRAHADKHFPPEDDRPGRRAFRRHLLAASARIADNPISLAQAAEALRSGNYIACRTEDIEGTADGDD
jgi:hypothetical protein